MSIRYLNWAFDLELPADQGKAVLIALANYADEEGSCFPGQETLSLNTGQSISTIHRHIKRLEELGLVSRKARRNGRLRTSDRYYLHISEPVTMTGRESDPTGHDESVNRSPCNSEPVTMTGEPPENHQLEPFAQPSQAVQKIQKSQRHKDIMEALVDACNVNPETKSAWGAVANAAKEINDATQHLTDTDVVSEIHKRAKVYKQNLSYAKLSPNALAKHWGDCAKGSATVSQLYPDWTHGDPRVRAGR